jgi:hypothetical protein
VKTTDTTCVPDPPLDSDTVSGCEIVNAEGVIQGSPLVRTVIDLDGDPNDCRVTDVKPDEICVVRGGVIRWKVKNKCGDINGNRDEPAIKVTELVQIEDENGNRIDPKPADWLFKSCDPQIDSLLDGEGEKLNLLHCDVGKNAPLGKYKYSLGGKIEPYDPPITVRPPRGP